MEKVRIFIGSNAAITAMLNGTSYITDEKPYFGDDLSHVVVENEQEETLYTYNNAEVIECASIDGKYWFTFMEIPAEELSQAKTDAQVMYTALMTDTLIEEE